jgi:isopentenyl phosphate kinase
LGIGESFGDLVFVKIGGSFITYKDVFWSVNYGSLMNTYRILTGVLSRRSDLKILLGNGGGSFAHPVVRFFMNKGNDLLLTECWRATKTLNNIIVNYLIDHGLRVAGLQTSALIYCDSNGFHVVVKPIEHLLRIGIIPSIYGDCIIDLVNGVRVLSTEEVFNILADHLPVKRIVLLTDVNGVYTCDPKKCSNAELIRIINRENIDEVLNMLSSNRGSDVTGSIYGKVKYMAEISLRHKIPVLIVSGNNVGEAIRAISDGVISEGTVIDLR